MFRKSAGVVAALVLLGGLSPITVQSYGKGPLDFTIQTISGNSGTSFVYFQAHESRSGRTTTVPTRRFAGCPVPYYALWKNISYGPNTTSYDVVIYSCATGKPIDNVNRAGLLFWGPGRQILIAGVQQAATGRIVYALNVSLNPANLKAGQTARLSASIADDFVAQADRSLSISVDPNAWRVTSWTIDFGDGQGATLPGGSTNVAVDHRYAAPQGTVQPKVTAHVAGTAQVADFDPVTGGIILLAAPFTVDVTNSTSGSIGLQPVVAYTAPQVRPAFVSELAPGPPPAWRRGFASVEVPRGSTVFLYCRPAVDREGEMTLDGLPAGSGQTSILAWTFRSGSVDGPAAKISRAGATGGPGDAIVQQWNAPDRIGPAGPTAYVVSVDYTVRTTYPDGQTRDYGFSGQVPVTVAYSASSG